MLVGASDRFDGSTSYGVHQNGEHGQDEEHNEENLRRVEGEVRDQAESEECGDHRNDQECKCHAEHDLTSHKRAD